MPDPVCARCAKPLPEEFYWAKKDGKTTGQGVCVSCATEKEKAA